MVTVIESWRDVKGYEGVYQVSDIGNVRSLDRKAWHPISGMTVYRGRVLIPRKHTQGYERVQFSGKDFYIHRLVLETFGGPAPSGMTDVNHKNGDKTDNRIENLEWCTRKENMQHAVATGLLINNGENHACATTSNDLVRAAYELVKFGVSRKEAVRQTGATLRALDQALQGNRAGFEKVSKPRGWNKKIRAVTVPQ